MNIFFLDNNIDLCCRYHVDRHTVKMIVEYCQILSTVHHKFNTSSDILLKSTHINHPCVKWAEHSINAYHILIKLTTRLCQEYTYRYGKIHLYERNGLLEFLINNYPKNMSKNNILWYPKAMPQDISCLYGNDLDEVIKAYRHYYITHKNHIFNWKKREIPLWITEKL